ncbi:hypothetical protein HRG_000520 [Hirsutella rhossiliensis]|uniref:Uncharacterized protein n=1 Tax=Hirsutella rhossiliensis TaxID=111463 RepID=A0A9P8SLU4_9HYPO|nr:uncharacterized protein HRG_00520 [Hirsutella rhossiliensis]KAH0967878.1 hypothetical protein HRG_00520 [Hirsutella rhossiliensis]
MAEPVKVPGHNNATYGPVPKKDQLLHVEFVEMAPSPVPVDQIFFLYLRGVMPPSDKDLGTAKLSITLSVVLPDGQHEDPKTYTVPLCTTAFGDAAHLSIRNATGAYVDHLGGGTNDILVDCAIPSVFLQTGTWTFETVASLDDGTCLFAMSLTQWLEGRLNH